VAVRSDSLPAWQPDKPLKAATMTATLDAENHALACILPASKWRDVALNGEVNVGHPGLALLRQSKAYWTVRSLDFLDVGSFEPCLLCTAAGFLRVRLVVWAWTDLGAVEVECDASGRWWELFEKASFRSQSRVSPTTTMMLMSRSLHRSSYLPFRHSRARYR
jgi:hypothetical protein